MHEVGTRVWRRPASAEDEGVVYDVFSSTWQHAVAAMPNPALAQHFLRIQYTAENRLLAARHPDLERWIVMSGEKPAGRLYLHRSATSIHVADLSLLPEHRGRGIGTALIRELQEDAAARGLPLTLRVARAQERLLRHCERLGFRPSSTDDLDVYLEWSPAPVA